MLGFFLFAKNLAKIFAFFTQIAANEAKLYHNIGLQEKRHFSTKICKTREYIDYNIEPLKNSHLMASEVLVNYHIQLHFSSIDVTIVPSCNPYLCTAN
jgi:hypothetical protein